MIRVATRSDLNRCVAIILDFIKDTAYSKHVDNIDINHIRQLVYGLLTVGTVWLYEVDNKPVGILAALKEPNIWVPNKVSMKELVWYVKPEHRGSVGSGKLFVKYTQACEQMMKRGEIDGYFTGRMSTSPDVDLEARGFRLVEKLYLRD